MKNYIIDHVSRIPLLESYFLENKFSDLQIFKFLKDVEILDDYSDPVEKVYELTDIKFRIEPEDVGSFTVHPMAINSDNKVINLSSKFYSYLPIVNMSITSGLQFIMNNYRKIVLEKEIEIVEEEVFQFFDCFPFSPLHNIDDVYNLIYVYKKYNLTCKLLVIETDNFYYNQTLNSLKKYFNLEYFFVSLNKIYLFKKFKCTRQYHHIQKEPLEFIKLNYVKKICDEYELKKEPYYDNICIIKERTKDNDNNNEAHSFYLTNEFKEFLKKMNIINLDYLKNDLELKIYLTNKSKFILTSWCTHFCINVYKHCINMIDKKILLIGSSTNVLEKYWKYQFKDLFQKDFYMFYGSIIHTIIYENIEDKDISITLMPIINTLLLEDKTVI